MERGWISLETLQVLRAEQTSLHRVYSGYEGWVERCGDDFVLCDRLGVDARQWADQITGWAEERGLLVDRIFRKTLQPNPGDRSQGHYELLTGDGQGTIRTRGQEFGLNYWIDFSTGYSNGFFTDQRENRRFLRQAGSRRVLNLFSYTCAFSVVAAATGAETCSIDVARKALEWGKENFALNGLSTVGHRFMTDDAREAVRRMIKRGEKFDAIVCDPPTFGRNREGKVWKIDQDMRELVSALWQILSPGGHLLLSTNYSEWGEEHLVALAPAAEVCQVPRPIDLPEDEGARTVWLRRPQV